MSETEFSRAACIRRIIVENPEITLEDLRAKYKEEHGDTLPDQVHLLYQERANVRKKLGCVDLSSLPSHHGRFNLTGFVRDFCVGMTEDQARKFVEYFGFEMSYNIYRNAMKQAENGPSIMTFEPDANQNSGPRSRKKGKPGRKKEGDKTVQPVLTVGTYESIESSLDTLIQQAQGLHDSPLAESLKNARRQVGASILGSN